MLSSFKWKKGGLGDLDLPCGGRSLASRCPWVCSGWHLLFWEVLSSLSGCRIALWVPSVEIYWCRIQGPSIRRRHLSLSVSHHIFSIQLAMTSNSTPECRISSPTQAGCKPGSIPQGTWGLRKARVRNSICSLSRGPCPIALCELHAASSPGPQGEGTSPVPSKAIFSWT